MRCAKRAAVGLALWTTAACAGGEGSGGDGGWSGTAVDSAGISVVTSTGDGTWGEADHWRLSEELRIGTMDGDPSYQFGQISGIAPLPDGRIVVMDQQAQELRIFGPTGEHVRTVGGPGSGPGEFALGAGPVLIGLGDTLYVPDVTNRRVNRYTPEGEPLGSFSLDFAEAIPLSWQDDGHGRIVSQLRPLTLPGQPPRDSMDVFVARGAGGVVSDTLLTAPSGRTVSFAGGGPSFRFFSAEPVWALAGESGFVFAVNDRYSISVYGPDGAVRRIIRRPFERRPVTEEDQTLLTERLVDMWKEFGVSGPQLEGLRQSIGFAEFYPAFASIRGGPEGTVWVQGLQTPSALSPEERERFNPQLGFGASTWDVFGADGRYLGRMDMPTGFQPLRFEGDRVFGILRDELEVQHVLVLRLDRGDARPEG